MEGIMFGVGMYLFNDMYELKRLDRHSYFRNLKTL